MKTLIMKLLGLNTLVNDIAYLKETLSNVEAKNEEFANRIKHLDDEVNALEERVQEKIDELPDMDNYVSEDDINDRIESYMNDNDYVMASYVDDEIESKVSDKVEEAIDDLDIDEKVRDLFNDASPAPMSEDDIRKEVSEAVKVTLEKMVKALADQQK